MVEGCWHELASCGFWLGGSAEGTFYAYAYAYPGPTGFADSPVRSEQAFYDTSIQ